MSIFKNNNLVCEILLAHSMVNAKEIKMAKQDIKTSIMNTACKTL